MPILELECKEDMKSEEEKMDAAVTKPSALDKVDCKDKPLDDSLTNLQWLQECKINIQEIASNTSFPYSPAPSVSSDESRSDGEGDEYSIPRSSRTYFSEDDKIDYKTNPHIKPPYSYATLICMAMKAANTPKMTLSAIYRWITDNYVYYKYAEPSWQNSIRHNLSLNKCFMKVPRKKGDPGKGGYWRLVTEYADKLLESSARKRRASQDVGSHSPQFAKRQRLEKLTKPLSPSALDSNIKQNVRQLIGINTNQYNGYFADQLIDNGSHTDHTYGKQVEVTEAPARKIKEEEEEEGVFQEDEEEHFTDEDMDIYPEALKEDFSWSSIGVDGLGESMHLLQQELLEARSGAFSTSPFFGFPGYETSSPFCLSPPPSADDVSGPVNFTDELNLTVVGRSMRIHAPSPRLVNELKHSYIKEEPLSPVEDEALWNNDIDLHTFSQTELCLN